MGQIVYMYRKIWGTKKKLKQCCFCHGRLDENCLTKVKVTEKENVVIEGSICTKCNCFFSPKIEQLTEKLKEHPDCGFEVEMIDEANLPKAGNKPELSHKVPEVPKVVEKVKPIKKSYSEEELQSLAEHCKNVCGYKFKYQLYFCPHCGARLGEKKHNLLKWGNRETRTIAGYYCPKCDHFYTTSTILLEKESWELENENYNIDMDLCHCRFFAIDENMQEFEQGDFNIVNRVLLREEDQRRYVVASLVMSNTGADCGEFSYDSGFARDIYEAINGGDSLVEYRYRKLHVIGTLKEPQLAAWKEPAKPKGVLRAYPFCSDGDILLTSEIEARMSDDRRIEFGYILREIQSEEPLYLMISRDKACNKKTPVNGVIHYASVLARTLMGQVIHEEKSIVELNGVEYRVLRQLVRQKNVTLLQKEILLSSQGGLTQYLSYGEEIVDVLFYSYRTKKYEILQATYNRMARKYCVDPMLFWDYCKKYGIPDRVSWQVAKRPKGKDGKDFIINLRPVSILRECGYSTNMMDDLTTKERRDIITAVLELKLMTQGQILRLLKGNISRHKSRSYPETLAKWYSDIGFVIRYRSNPDKFVFGTDVRK